MALAKPLFIVTTSVGVASGLYEGYRLAGGLVIIMAAMIGLLTCAIVLVIATVRRERRLDPSDHPRGER